MNAGDGHSRHEFLVQDYDLDATLTSGQAFRWTLKSGAWTGVVEDNWVSLRTGPGRIVADCASQVTTWEWLARYLQVNIDLSAVIHTFPDDPPMRATVTYCRGLRLLRQPLWECLASFVLSSTKRILQIRQVVAELCRTFGDPVPVPPGIAPEFSFPSAERLAGVAEADLRACKMGFRAPYLLMTAREVASGRARLETYSTLPVELARAELMRLPGVGRKIADCVLLFGYGFPAAFPIDVWVLKALKHFYFPRRRVTPAKLRLFADTHFGPFAGYAQQYLFHYVRIAGGLA